MSGKWTDAGEAAIGGVFFKGDAAPTLWLALYTNTTEPAEDATISSITELAVSNGYDRVKLSAASWASSGSTFYHPQVTYTASGANWGAVYGYAVINASSAGSGAVYGVEHFSDGPYTVNDAGSTKVTPKFPIA